MNDDSTIQIRNDRLKPLENEAELINKAQQGETGAFKKLFDCYNIKVYNFVLRMVGKPYDAEDIVQEVFIKMYRKLTTLKDSKYFSTWLFSIARNESINFLSRVRAKNFDSLDDESENFSEKLTADEPSRSPEQHSELSELEVKLLFALNELPEKNRTAFVLGVIEGQTYKDVSEILGCSINNVKSLVFRARSSLCQKLSPYLEG